MVLVLDEPAADLREKLPDGVIVVLNRQQWHRSWGQCNK
jgi:hypothetical protein